MTRLLSGLTESPCAERARPRFYSLLPLLQRSSGADRILRVPVHQAVVIPLGRVFWEGQAIRAVVRGGNLCLTRGVEPTLENHRKSLGPYTGRP